MALVHLKREVAEFEGYPLECDVPEEQVTEMESRGWSVVKKAAEKPVDKVSVDKQKATDSVKREGNVNATVGNNKKEG